MGRNPMDEGGTMRRTAWIVAILVVAAALILAGCPGGKGSAGRSAPAKRSRY